MSRDTISAILNRQKDIQYSSRIASHIVRQRETHKLRHVITNLLEFVPEEEKNDPLYKELAGYRCDTRMHAVRLLSPKLSNETLYQGHRLHPAGISSRWEAGQPTPGARSSDRRGSASGVCSTASSFTSPSLVQSPQQRSSRASHPPRAHYRKSSRQNEESGAAMNACSGISAIQILLVAVTFLLAVLSLDVFWVRVPNSMTAT